MTSTSVNLTHHFLIAMPGMVDPNFSRSLTYICEHNERGALGLVVNRPSDMTVATLFKSLALPLAARRLGRSKVLNGGPVQVDRGFVLHRPVGEWKSTLPVADDIALTTSLDILEAVGKGEGPIDLLLTMGYSGWAAGQLEEELLQNAWLTVAAEEEILFEMPADKRLPAAMALLGVDYACLSETAGHA
ncbi:MAG: YqgE/AlgH family protein [Burkholderiales bacterium]